MPMLDPGPGPVATVNPQERLDFVKSTLGDEKAVKLTVTEALDFNSDRERIGQKAPSEAQEKRALAHLLTIEKAGKGFRVQDIAVDADGQFSVSELRITRKGKIVWQPGISRATDTLNLGAIEARETPLKGQQIYQHRRADALVDRLVLGEIEGVTNEVLQREPVEGIAANKRDFDATVRSALEHFDTSEVTRMIKTGETDHAFKEQVASLLPLAKKRAAQVTLATTLQENGLAGFSMTGDDLNGL